MLRQAIFANALRPAAAAAAAAATPRTVAASPLLLRARAARTQPRFPMALTQRGVVPASRWYSDNAKDAAKEEGKEEAKQGTAEAGEAVELKKKLEGKDKEVATLKDQYLRLLAEFKTLQDRSKRDHKTAREFAIQKFAADLCDSVDNLDRALAGVPEEKLTTEERTEHLQDLVNLHEGLKLTQSMLMETLRNHGVERFDPHGEKFNANEHEVTIMVPHPDHEDNTVVQVEKKGFKLNGRLLRAAQVQVAKNLKKATS